MERASIFINEQRLKETIEQFADFGRTAGNGVTRLALSDEDIRVRALFRTNCEQLGMTVATDDMGCMYATLAGSEQTPPIVIGSHLDSVRLGGRFDGSLGVIAGLEVVRTLKDHGIKPRTPIIVMNFTNEEGARFEPSMMASGVLSGKFDKAAMMAKQDTDGISFAEALHASGCEGDAMNRLSEAAAYLELHIEQGPVLERTNVTIGAVECVVGMACYEIEVRGESNHAGTTPMTMRKDALFAANDLIQALRTQLDELGDSDLVYTMGRINAYPNIHTVIPNKVMFTIEARHKDEAVIRRMEKIVQSLAQPAGGCEVRATKLWGRDTVWFDPALCERIEASARELGCSCRRMVSGAGHDAQFMASYVPSAMIFVPSVNGKSHCEEEFTPYEDCAKGVNVLFRTVLSLIG